MTDVKTDPEPEVDEVGGGDDKAITSWEFLNQPTVDDVLAKLKELPDWWGIAPSDYVDFIQPLSQSKNISTDKTKKDYRTTWTLYVTVAGRVRMVNDAALVNNWYVDFQPEMTTPTGIPGMLQFDDNRIVYREYCVITDAENNRVVGRKPGTAWVPAQGGSGAVASNRFEKVETSARGRSIAAWGFGVLPGSGVASLDEMLSVSEMRQAVTQERQRISRGEGGPVDRRGLEEELRMKIVEFQQVSGSTDPQMDARVMSYVKQSFGKDIDRKTDGSWELSDLKDGEVILFRNRMISEIQKIKNEQGV